MFRRAFGGCSAEMHRLLSSGLRDEVLVELAAWSGMAMSPLVTSQRYEDRDAYCDSRNKSRHDTGL